VSGFENIFLYVLSSLALTLLAFVFSNKAAYWVSIRSARQPVSYSIDDEREFLHSVLRSPVLYPAVGELESKEFSIEVYKAVWDAIRYEMRDYQLVDDISRWKEMGGFLDIDLKSKVMRGLLHNSIGVSGDIEDTVLYEAYNFVNSLSVDKAQGADEHDVYAALRRGRVIRDNYLDRTMFNGGSVIVNSNESYGVPFRRAVMPKKGRLFMMRIALMLFLGCAPFVASYYETGLSWGLALCAVLSLSLMSVLVSFVDQDTMYLDMPVFFIGTGLAWLFSVLADISAGEPERLLAGVFVVVPLFIVFEVTNFLFQRLKGVSGMGFGDTLLLIGTSGVPAALSGSYLLGLHSLIAGLLCGVFVWSFKRVKGEITRDTPFAFGPYLAIGWIFAWLFTYFL
jgi:prepilin signal peptidase PulO-like enzyme (type II secretory pathway)